MTNLEQEVLLKKKQFYTMANGLLSLTYIVGIAYCLYSAWNILT